MIWIFKAYFQIVYICFMYQKQKLWMEENALFYKIHLYAEYDLFIIHHINWLHFFLPPHVNRNRHRNCLYANTFILLTGTWCPSNFFPSIFTVPYNSNRNDITKLFHLFFQNSWIKRQMMLWKIKKKSNTFTCTCINQVSPYHTNLTRPYLSRRYSFVMLFLFSTSLTTGPELSYLASLSLIPAICVCELIHLRYKTTIWTWTIS